jgi:hypothetical protein
MNSPLFARYNSQALRFSAQFSDPSGPILSLELQENADSVSQAISAYIAERTSRIESLQDDPPLQQYVQQVLHQKAEGTFLWVALVVKELEDVDSYDVRQVVDDVPKSLHELYARMVGPN